MLPATDRNYQYICGKINDDSNRPVRFEKLTLVTILYYVTRWLLFTFEFYSLDLYVIGKNGGKCRPCRRYKSSKLSYKCKCSKQYTGANCEKVRQGKWT